MVIGAHVNHLWSLPFFWGSSRYLALLASYVEIREKNRSDPRDGSRGLMALRRVTDDQADDAPRQHDLPVVVVMQCVAVHDRDWQRERRADDQAEDNAQGKRVHLLRKPADQSAGDEPFEGRADHDAGDL